MRRLRMIVALDRVGHGLSDAMSGLDAAQEAAPVVRGRRFLQNHDQFRIHWWQGNNQLKYKDNAKKGLFLRVVFVFLCDCMFT